MMTRNKNKNVDDEESRFYFMIAQIESLLDQIETLMRSSNNNMCDNSLLSNYKFEVNKQIKEVKSELANFFQTSGVYLLPGELKPFKQIEKTLIGLVEKEKNLNNNEMMDVKPCTSKQSKPRQPQKKQSKAANDQFASNISSIDNDDLQFNDSKIITDTITTQNPNQVNQYQQQMATSSSILSNENMVDQSMGPLNESSFKMKLKNDKTNLTYDNIDNDDDDDDKTLPPNDTISNSDPNRNIENTNNTNNNRVRLRLHKQNEYVNVNQLPPDFWDNVKSHEFWYKDFDKWDD